jgi:hypothetical protein
MVMTMMICRICRLSCRDGQYAAKDECVAAPPVLRLCRSINSVVADPTCHLHVITWTCTLDSDGNGD